MAGGIMVEKSGFILYVLVVYLSATYPYKKREKEVLSS
jgi:hypothetical protein